VLTDLGAIDDPYAERMLDSTTGRILWGVRYLVPGSVRRRSVTLAGLAARVRWHDEQVASALNGGIDQVVVVGAGYDSRAWRFARDGVRFFEVDHPATQADKRHRAPDGGPTFVAADLRTGSTVEALAAAGLATERPAVFVLEGLTMYLPEADVCRLLIDLSSASAAGSRLTTDFYPPRDAGSSRNRRQDRVQSVARGGSGEELHLTVNRDDAVTLVQGSGWAVTDAVATRDVATTLPPGLGLPVDAINPGKTLLAARI
jgi:methyltransferase (TIGR00027 family)